jgi:hypothetical protein
MRFSHEYADLEYADMSRPRRSLSLHESYLRHLATLPTPPKGATLTVLRAWHQARLKKLEGEGL